MQEKNLQIVSFLTLLVLFPGTMLAQSTWQMQSSGTTASLRGIHAVSGQVAWVSGTKGTVLRTVDGGRHWQSCNVPRGASTLDFRSIWAGDADHAMAMSSGPGNQSRLYSTHDGCRSWRLIFTNPDRDGFWDALQFDGVRFGAILGDPVHGSFALFATYDGGARWTRQVIPCLQTVAPQQGAFAASNQSLAVLPIEDPNSPAGPATNHQIWFGTSGGWLYGLTLAPLEFVSAPAPGCTHLRILPDASGKPNASAGIFAIAFRDPTDGVGVGGDYTKPRDAGATSAYTMDGTRWRPAVRPPAGYRSTVAWDNGDGTWIASGPSGSDTSRDEGKTWRPLGHEGWNALSLPFAVGPDGHIGRLLSWGQLRTENSVPAAGARHTALNGAGN